MTEEHVLVVPTAVLERQGTFHGFLPGAEGHLAALLDPANLRYLPRSLAEQDPAFKQLIPYVVLRCGGEVFAYTRGAGAGEARLRARRSLGVGGHICSGDAVAAPGANDAYRRGMLREVEEEVALGSPYRERLLGLINDDVTAVGRVHLGIVHVFDLEAPRATAREEGLATARFLPLAELRALRDEFETWSQFLLDHLGPA